MSIKTGAAPLRFSSFWEVVGREWEFWAIEIVILLVGGYFVFLLATFQFSLEADEPQLEPFARIAVGSPGPLVPNLEAGGEGDLQAPKNIGRKAQARKGGPSKAKPNKNALDQSLVGVIASRSRTADSAFGRILQKSGIGSEVDRVLQNVKRNYGGTGSGESEGVGIAGGSRGGSGSISGTDFGVPGGTGTGYGIGTGYGGGGEDVSLGVRSAHKVKARLTQGRASIEGSLDAAVIDRVVKENLGGLKYCYERELTKNPKIGGKTIVQFTIGMAGSVTDASIESSSLGSPEVEDCILRRVKRWIFPKPQGGSVIVSYPFVFTSGS